MNRVRKSAPGGNRERVNGKPSSRKKVPTNSNNSTKKKEIQPVLNHKGWVIGYIFGNKFFKHVLGSKHMLRKPPGWANDISIIETLKENKVQNIEIHDDETGIVYSSTLENLLEHGFKFDRGFGGQICLPLKYWKICEKETPTQPNLQLDFLTGISSG